MVVAPSLKYDCGFGGDEYVVHGGVAVWWWICQIRFRGDGMVVMVLCAMVSRGVVVVVMCGGGGGGR